MLSNATWQALAAEYNKALRGAADGYLGIESVTNAEALADYVGERTRTITEDGVTLVWCLGRASVWEAVEDDTPYVDFEAMVTAYDESIVTPLKLQVSDLWHDHPVFSRDDNLRFRVWHDTAHIDHGLSFTADDEVELFRAQAAGIGSQAVRDALFCESVYQLAAAHVAGKYPDRQVVRTPGPVGRALLDAWGL